MSATSKFPDFIPISLEDKVIHLKVQYEWKLDLCSLCNSLAHSVAECPSIRNHKPHVEPPNLGRSFSRQPMNKLQSRPPAPKCYNPPPSTQLTSPKVTKSPIKASSTSKPDTTSQNLAINHPPPTINLIPSQVILKSPHTFPITTDNHQSTPSSSTNPPTTTTSTSQLPDPMIQHLHNNPSIPNLNSPTDFSIGLAKEEREEVPSFSLVSTINQSKNKFSALQHFNPEQDLLSTDTSSFSNGEFQDTLSNKVATSAQAKSSRWRTKKPPISKK